MDDTDVTLSRLHETQNTTNSISFTEEDAVASGEINFTFYMSHHTLN